MLSFPAQRDLTCVSSASEDAYQKVGKLNSQSCPCHNVQWHGLCRQVTRLTMQVSHYGWLLICHVTLCVNLLYSKLFIDSCLPQYGLNHILLHPANYHCYFQLYGQLFNMGHGAYCPWLHWKCHAGLTGVCLVAMCQHLLVGSIQIHSLHAVVSVEGWFGVVEIARKMIRKRHGKSWGLYCSLYLKMDK